MGELIPRQDDTREYIGYTQSLQSGRGERYCKLENTVVAAIAASYPNNSGTYEDIRSKLRR